MKNITKKFKDKRKHKSDDLFVFKAYWKNNTHSVVISEYDEDKLFSILDTVGSEPVKIECYNLNILSGLMIDTHINTFDKRCYNYMVHLDSVDEELMPFKIKKESK